MVRRTAPAAVWAHRQNKEPAMRTRPLMTTALATAGLLMAGGVALAAANSVSTTPEPQVVIPSSSSADRHGGPDDRAPHDPRDAKRGARTITTTTRHDDPASHDATDDKGGSRASTSSDDPATHDATDDNGGTRTTTSRHDDPATHDATDDKGGSGSGGHGSDG